ncbi:ABC transporter permease [Acidobacterium sp. S8]|uniref:ABC transporter permease n=1 Tax=Acidobacterium sp. S8 TaxID=1641854 RepID=UPI0020B177EA|nr:ABC transporter permease [Acidobacterium sp. S8]
MESIVHPNLGVVLYVPYLIGDSFCRGLYMHEVLQDIRYTLRQLRRSPGFALTAILTLTLAIGANVVVFGVLNALVLHSLPVPEASRIFQIQHPGGIAMSYPNYRDIRDRNRTFSNVAMYRLARIGFDANGTAQPVWGYEVSGNYFDMLGIKPVLGRFLHPADDANKNGSPNAVLSYACWKVRFGGDPNVVGKTVRLNKQPYTVIGVAPQSFNGTERFFWPEIWVPVQDEEQIEGYSWLDSRGNSNSWDIGRLKPGITPAQATADLANVAALLAQQYPEDDRKLHLTLTQPGLLGNALSGPVHAFLYGVMGLALLVLLAACANLGGLFAARSADRAREMGIRIAVGSSRRRILRQLLTESVLLAVAGGAVAAFAAAQLLHLLTVWRPQSEIPVQFLVEPGAGIYIFAVLLALFTGVLFGVVPARQIWKTDPNQVLKAAGATDAGQRRFALRDILLAVQIALCCLLVTASFVSLRGLLRTFTMPIGIRPDGVTLASMDLHLAGYGDADIPAAQQRLLDAVAHIPGVTAAAFSDTTPLSLNQNGSAIYAPGTTDFGVAGMKFNANVYKVSPDYFSVAGTRLLAGRAFTVHDDKHAPQVAIVNRTFAKQLFGTENVVGKLYMAGMGQNTEIVGVVEDGKYETLAEDLKPVVYRPFAQSRDSSLVLLARSDRSGAEIIPAMRQAIAGVDPALPVFSLSAWPDALSFVMLPARAATVALGILGALGMMLAITGIFGMASYTVSKRMRELGIRVALGAQNRHVLRAALGRATLLLGAGSLAGLILGLTASWVLASIVYQASASDPLVILAAVLTMALVGLLSAAIPARRALLAEPAQLLRDE